MPKQTYALVTGGPKRLALDWKFGYKDLTLHLDDRLVGKVPGRKELQDGETFTLPDGSKLVVRLVSSFLSTDLSLERNGKPVPGSASDPLTQVRLSYQLLFFIAIINLALGGLSLMAPDKFPNAPWLAWYNLILGLVFIGLGLWVRSLSLLGLWISVVVLGIDILITFYGMSASSGEIFYTGALVRILILIYVYRGIRPLKQLTQNKV